MRTITLARSLGFLVLLLAAAHVPGARAQSGKLTGIVTDAQTGQPIEGVSVFLLGTGRGAITGANGRYFILSVPPGDYTLTIESKWPEGGVAHAVLLAVR